MTPLTKMEQVLRPGALRIEFQPMVTVHDGGADLYALEALTRGPRGTTMERPDVLFEYARRKGQETELDMLCIGAALAEAAILPGQPHISLNVHGTTLCNVPHFARTLLAAAHGHGISARRLMLEIVEHRAAWGIQALRATLDDLRSAGVRIAIDDLGVGASNYHMFIDCRPDHLKIDRYIVNGCSNDPYRIAVLRSIVALASACGARPIAEGVERKDDLAAVRELGIDCVQGWLYARSAPAAEIATSRFLNPHADGEEKRPLNMKKKVLLVDDSNTVLMMEKMILSKGPFELVVARDGMEAVAKSRTEQPDIILLDVMMPNLDGLSACAAIRAQAETAGIPIIMVTTRGEEHNIETAFRNGCTDYVTKPINGLELLTKLHNILGLSVSGSEV
jgi:EAL domain-containing protein (putative c-di-GMP-specific phosphodiesterase class I)/CheY-like chemotaxis protein